MAELVMSRIRTQPSFSEDTQIHIPNGEILPAINGSPPQQPAMRPTTVIPSYSHGRTSRDSKTQPDETAVIHVRRIDKLPRVPFALRYLGAIVAIALLVSSCTSDATDDPSRSSSATATLQHLEETPSLAALSAVLASVAGDDCDSQIAERVGNPDSFIEDIIGLEDPGLRELFLAARTNLLIFDNHCARQQATTEVTTEVERLNDLIANRLSELEVVSAQ